jgi:uncharacterized phage-associated protein
MWHCNNSQCDRSWHFTNPHSQVPNKTYLNIMYCWSMWISYNRLVSGKWHWSVGWVKSVIYCNMQQRENILHRKIQRCFSQWNIHQQRCNITLHKTVFHRELCIVLYQFKHTHNTELSIVLRHSGHILNTELYAVTHKSGKILNKELRTVYRESRNIFNTELHSEPHQSGNILHAELCTVNHQSGQIIEKCVVYFISLNTC